MHDRELFEKAFSPLHASPDTLTEVRKTMRNEKKTRRALGKSAVVAIAAVVQACNFPAACFVLLFFPWFACVVLYVLAKAAERHANDLHAAAIDGLATWIKGE